MRTLSAFLLCAVSATAGDGAMNPSERAYLLDVLDSTQKAMIAGIQGVSDAQWRFKPAPEVWSVQECAEHIILAEDFLRNTAMKVVQTPAVARLATATPENDRKLFESVQDRSKKASAPEPIRPGAKFATPADAVREFTARRGKTVEYVKSSNDDLRTRVTTSPLGQLDAYQFLLLLASHSARHTAQIREVQANAAYPKSK
jgi:hypothetical protein